MENGIFEKKTWAIVELMGRQVVAGEITEVTVVGATMLRIDVPPIYEEGLSLDGYTKFYGATAIYAITPTDEASARHAVQHLHAQPINEWTIPVREFPQPQLIDEPCRDDEAQF